MPVEAPDPGQLEEAAAAMGLSLDEEDIPALIRIMQGNVQSYRLLEEMDDPAPEIRYPRDGGHRPDPTDNPLNAWYYQTHIEGAAEGPLKGKTVVLKDNIMLAGVPMMNGAWSPEGHVPDMDATVVTRILDAGGTIAGKANCEYLCSSGSSFTCAAGPVHNPYKHGYSAGGSSSGCAALVAAGEIDMAVGGDQGGSIRVPASFCGLYGMKPTHGLVPYTGMMGVDAFIDYSGPITRTVENNALLLEAIAGADGFDPRQCAPTLHPYSELLEGGVERMKIAVVEEGFGHPGSEADVDAKVRAAAATLGELGAVVTEVSIPWHRQADPVFTPIAFEGRAQTMIWGDGYGGSGSDLYSTALIDFSREWQRRATGVPVTVLVMALFGAYVRRRYGARYYAKAMNLVRKLTAAYDAVLAEYDLLLMPTSPVKPQPLPPPDASLEEQMFRAFEMITNTFPFNASHHPAMSVPCGTSNGLPIGMMLVGRHFDEPTIYKAAYAFEQAGDWRKM